MDPSMNPAIEAPLADFTFPSEHHVASADQHAHAYGHGHHQTFPSGAYRRDEPGSSPLYEANGLHEREPKLVQHSQSMPGPFDGPSAYDRRHPAPQADEEEDLYCLPRATYLEIISGPYPHTAFGYHGLPDPIVPASNGYQPAFGAMSGMRISSITERSADYVGKAPAPSSPAYSTSARYATAIPDSRLLRSPRGSRRSIAIPKTPRGVGSYATAPRPLMSPGGLAESPTSPSFYGQGYGSNISHDNTGNQPVMAFERQNVFYGIHLQNGTKVDAEIDVKVDKGFFVSPDGAWTCYRRNYFSVGCSYSIDPCLHNGSLYLDKDKKRQKIMAIGMTISANVDGPSGKSIELVQHTPKRDLGPKFAIEMQKLHPNNKGNIAVGYSLGYGAPNTARIPSLPCQNQDNPPRNETMTSLPNAHNHTFERIQFKQATANNGKRRAAQQYYNLNVELWVDVRETSNHEPHWVKVSSRTSPKIVVRGRSPSHYQNEHGDHAHPPHGGVGGAGAGGSGSAPTYTTGGAPHSIPRLYSNGGYGVIGSSAYHMSHLPAEPQGLDEVPGVASIRSVLDGQKNYTYFPGPLHLSPLHLDTRMASGAPDVSGRLGGALGGATGLDGGSSCSKLVGLPSSRGLYTAQLPGMSF